MVEVLGFKVRGNVCQPVEKAAAVCDYLQDAEGSPFIDELPAPCSIAKSRRSDGHFTQPVAVKIAPRQRGAELRLFNDRIVDGQWQTKILKRNWVGGACFRRGQSADRTEDGHDPSDILVPASILAWNSNCQIGELVRIELPGGKSSTKTVTCLRLSRHSGAVLRPELCRGNRRLAGGYEPVGRAIDHIDSAGTCSGGRRILARYADGEIGEAISVEVAKGNATTASTVTCLVELFASPGSTREPVA
jgi:hypothetical protein